MSIPMTYAGGAAVAAAAAQRKREEEEKLTTYTKEDLTEGWEFKIVRSNTALKGEKFAQLCEEEAQSGWEFLEKFDDYRVRFKRSVEHRKNDRYASIDPYRTQYGMSDGALVALILGIVAMVVAGIVWIAVALS